MVFLIIFSCIVLYVLCVIGSSMWNCIEKIPGAMEDEKLQTISKYFDPLWYFLVDKTPRRSYNKDRQSDPYRINKFQDPLWTGWKDDDRHQ